jgi:PPM family protein phosphatase
VLVAGVAWLLVSYARESYFVAFQGEEVVIQQGRPGGFLLWDPTVVEETGIQRDELQPVAQQVVADQPTRSSLASAEELVAGLQLADEPQDETQDEGDQGDADADADEEEDSPSSTSTTEPTSGTGGAGAATGGTGAKEP